MTKTTDSDGKYINLKEVFPDTGVKFSDVRIDLVNRDLINKILDDTGIISESVSRPINMVSTMLMGIKGGSAIMKLLGKKD